MVFADDQSVLGQTGFMDVGFLIRIQIKKPRGTILNQNGDAAVFILGIEEVKDAALFIGVNGRILDFKKGKPCEPRIPIP